MPCCPNDANWISRRGQMLAHEAVWVAAGKAKALITIFWAKRLDCEDCHPRVGMGS